MTSEEINNMKYKVCCPMCDNYRCVRGTDKCEAEIWAKQKAESEGIHCNHTDVEIAKSFIEDVEAVKNLLP